jgi:uncharacterized membrane protein YedE/YeeE
VLALVCGAVFAAGLAISGMTQPSKVTGFLDLTGAWDPSLAFVMVGAIGVHAVFVRIAKKRARPFLADEFSWPTRTRVEPRLVAGAALFGVGWGLSGFCPGPALVSLASLAPLTLVFGATLAVTLVVTRTALRRAEKA